MTEHETIISHGKRCKLHSRTRDICLICEEPITLGITLHKTLRQTHSLCEECMKGYLNPKLESMTDLLRQGIRKDVGTINCPGNINGVYRNICSCEIKLSSLFYANYSQRNNPLLNFCRDAKCHKVRKINESEYENIKCEKICRKMHLQESASSLNKRTGIISMLPPKLDPCSEMGTDMFRIIYTLSRDDSYICQNRQCNAIIEANENLHEIKCAGCKITWCKMCNVSPYHTNMSCLAYESSQSNTEDGKYKWELYRKGELKDCPGCFAPTMKRDGCNKMHCNRCDTTWCWLCRENKIEYRHFNDQLNTPCANKLYV